MSQLTPHYLIVGEVLRPHGVRGELRVRVLTEHPERFIKGDVKTVHLGTDPNQAQAIPYTVRSARMHKNYLLFKFEEIRDRDDADTLRGQFIMVDFENAIPLDEGEYYAYEIIGLAVQTTDEQTLGTIRDVIQTGANDVFIVKGGPYGELLLPAHDETLLKIDFDAQIVTMSLPDGLLPETSDSP